MAANKIKISIVIATYNRGQGLAERLGTYLKQNYPADQFELIVVDDGSRDETKQVIERLIGQFQTGVVSYYRQPNQGPASARNLGIRHAQGQIIAISDDDCLASPNWLKEIDRLFSTYPDIVGVGGQTVSNPAAITPFTHQIQNNISTSFLTCNVAYRTDILRRIGGFNTGFPYPSNEDTELAWKMEKVGQMIYNPKMIITHPPRPAKFSKLVHGVRYLETEFILARRQPERYRRERGAPWYHIYIRIFWLHLARDAFRNLKWLKKPLIYGKLLILLFVQRLYILWLTPSWIAKYR